MYRRWLYGCAGLWFLWRLPMTVLVTGAAGFIGAHVCRALAARNDTVVWVR